MEKKLESAFKLVHILGLKADVKDNVHYLEESEVVYPAGRHVVIYNTEKKTQRYFSHSEEISTIAVSTGKHKLLAVAEKGVVPKIVVYDLTTRKRKTRAPLVCNQVSESRVQVCRVEWCLLMEDR